MFVDELNARCATALQRRIEVVNRKADVVDSRTALRHEARDRRAGIIRLEQLDEGLTRPEPDYFGAIGIVEADLLQTQYIAKKGKTLGDRLNRDSDVGNAGAARGCWGH
jgi:hypothetical protein